MPVFVGAGTALLCCAIERCSARSDCHKSPEWPLTMCTPQVLYAVYACSLGKGPSL